MSQFVLINKEINNKLSLMLMKFLLFDEADFDKWDSLVENYLNNFPRGNTSHYDGQ